MKVSQLFVRTLREAPTGTELVSHSFLLRGGYIKQLASGLYHTMPLGKKILNKIENLIRDEMNSLGGQEVDLPLVQTAELWKESRRYDLIGDELVRFKDRSNQEMVLAMTHEEAMTHLCNNTLVSYRQLPVMLYQVKLKFRDELRSRGGLVRVREFVMKDAYSFHESEESLDEYYHEMYKVYQRIFRKVGLNPIIVESNSGIMGGRRVSHEYMLECEHGEDYLILSEDGKYRANQEIAVFNRESEKTPVLELREVKTPNQKTTDEVSSFLGLKPKQIMKCVFFQNQKRLITVLLRGDLEVSLIKIKNYLGLSDLKLADEKLIYQNGFVVGFAGPIGIKQSKDNLVLVDISIEEGTNFVTGLNKIDYHYKNANFPRDFSSSSVGDFAMAKEGYLCIDSNSHLVVKKGIEIGNIFKLGQKFSQLAKAEFLDAKGVSKSFTMGCYGIGIGRLMASVVENSHDDYGPIWPKSITPYHVHLLHLGEDSEIIQKTESLYQELKRHHLDVLYDNRNEHPGVKFKDADLWGIPVRITISKKSLAENKCEYKIRGEKSFEKVDLDQVLSLVLQEYSE